MNRIQQFENVQTYAKEHFRLNEELFIQTINNKQDFTYLFKFYTRIIGFQNIKKDMISIDLNDNTQACDLFIALMNLHNYTAHYNYINFNTDASMSLQESYRELQTTSKNIFIKKNNDYGDAFATYGLVGVLVRMGDKVHRLETLQHTHRLVDTESIQDTLIDLYNYTVLAMMLLIETSMDKLNVLILQYSANSV